MMKLPKSRAEAVKITSWIRPKGEHKKLVSRAVQCRVHLVICLRAQEKMKIVKDTDGKQKIIASAERPVSERWEPICEKRFPYELTASFVLTPANPGVPVPVKLQDQHRPFFPLEKKIDEAAGAALAAWAHGNKVPAAADAPLTRGEVKQLEALLAAAGNRLTHEDVEGYQLAIHEKNAKVVRDGIRELSKVGV